MAGLAALEVAQSVSATWQAMWEARQESAAGDEEAESLTQAEQLQAPCEQFTFCAFRDPDFFFAEKNVSLDRS